MAGIGAFLLAAGQATDDEWSRSTLCALCRICVLSDR